MATKTRTRTCVTVLILLLLAAALLFLGYRYLSWRVAANSPLPQILIHRPIDGEILDTEIGTFIHATARSDAGITRIEIWADGRMLTAVAAPDPAGINPLLARVYWQPRTPGLHEIIVRAYDGNQFEGTASVVVRVETSGEELPVGYDPTGILEGGPDGPALDPEPSEPVGEGSDAGGEADRHPPDPAEPPADDAAPPEAAPDADPPGLPDLIPGGDDGGDGLPGEGDMTLYFEALSLLTGPGYEGVHCYVSAAGRLPQWYPDEDSDQSTDENFRPAEGGGWNVAGHLAGENALAVNWPRDEALPVEISCIGIAGGGTEAYELGSISMSIPPEEWDGIVREASAAAEGVFTLGYRIGVDVSDPFPEYPNIPPPTNVHLDERRQELQWDWEPGDWEGGIGGFLIYVNDTLVFRARSHERAVRLPYVWFSPPCEVSYNFTVRTYLNPYPDGATSDLGGPVVLPDPADPPRTDCNPEFVISFDTLVTGDLGGDDIVNNWAHMVGPTRGYFYVNEQEMIFYPVDLLPYHTYNLDDLIASTGGGMSRTVFEVAEGDYVRVGFDIMDYDGGNNEVLCTNAVFHDYTYDRLTSYGYFEDTLYSYGNDTHRCVVHYTIRPLEGSVFGSSNPHFMPLPWLDVTGLRQNPASGNLVVELRNTGSAAWTGHQLRLDFYDQIRESTFGTHSAPNTLEVGQTIEISTSVSPRHFGSTCVIVDPDDQVLELYESTGAYDSHGSLKYCLPLPDLRIEDVQFDQETSTLRIQILNLGENPNDLGTGAVDLADLVIRIDPDFTSVNMDSDPGQFGGQMLARAETTWLEWTLIPEQRALMEDGYALILDPGNNIPETSEDNNTLSGYPSKQIRVNWDGMFLRWYPSWYQDCTNDGAYAGKDWEVWVDVYARSEVSNRRLGSWHWEGRLPDTQPFSPDWGGWDESVYQVDGWLNGEETLAIEIRGEQERDPMGSATGEFFPWNNWEIMQVVNPGVSCDQPDTMDMGYSINAWPNEFRWSYCGSWAVYVNICEVNE